jgi:hypothetical protein
METKSSSTDNQNGVNDETVARDKETKVTALTLVLSDLAVIGLASRALTSPSGWQGVVEASLLWLSVAVFLFLFIVRLL